MPSPITPVIFDGHNDVLSKLMRAGGADAVDSFVNGRSGAVDVDKARIGGFGGGFFAIWVPSPIDFDLKMTEMSRPSYNLDMPDPIDATEALDVVMQQASILFRLEERDALKVCRSVADIETAVAAGKIAALFHIEGAEAIGTDLAALDVLYHSGLRSLGPVWSRDTAFAQGVPFRFPHSPDTGPGLTDAGKRLVARCNALGILVDLSHLNEAGFWDVARLSRAPLVATHSNAHAICPHSRNLTDEQLRRIAQSDGMVGVNLAVAFLRPDGQMMAGAGPDDVLRHFDHLIGILGEDRVGLGSDFDGAIVPDFLSTVADLPALREAMAGHGYSGERIEKICYRNWFRVLHATWGR